MRNALLLFWSLLLLFAHFQLSAQCPVDTPGILTHGANPTVLNYNQMTPAANFSQVPGGLPTLEFIITDLSRTTSTGPVILGVDTSAEFLPSDYGLGTGDSFCITPVIYDLMQIQDIVDELFTDRILGIIPCCTGVQSILGLNICDSLNQVGIFSGSDVTGLGSSLTLFSQFVSSGGGSTDLSVQDLIDAIGAANSGVGGTGLNDCGVPLFPICFSLEKDSAICYTIECLDTAVVAPVFFDTLCKGQTITVGTNTYAANGIYTDTVLTVNLCDSIVTLDLTMADTFHVAIDDTFCQGRSFDFLGNLLTAAGDYTDTIAATNGCDSIIDLDLVMLPLSTTSLDDTICQGDTFWVGSSAYTSTGIYSDTLVADNSCDSIITTDLTVLSPVVTNIIDTICDGENYAVGSSSYTSSGNFADTFVSFLNCDSIVNLDLTVLSNAVTNLMDTICNGDTFWVGTSAYTTSGNSSDTFIAYNNCDSIVNLQLFVKPVFFTSLSESICPGDDYKVGTSSYSSAGNYYDTIVATNGCDSVVNLVLSILSNPVTNITDTICDSDTFSVGSSKYVTTGIYADTFTAFNSCDSIVNLDLTVRNPINNILSIGRCANDTFVFGGNAITTNGTYKDTFLSINNCDSMVSLTLTFDASISTILNEDICPGGSFTMNGNTFTSDTTHYDTLASFKGCDSIVTLNLTVLPDFVTNLNETICSNESFKVGSKTYTIPNTYADTLTATNGCDSIVNLTLNVLDTFATSLTATICFGESSMVGTSVYSSSGNFIDVLTASNGCDSVVSLDLTVLPLLQSSIMASICQGASYSFDGQNLSTGGVYKDTVPGTLGCDSIVTLNLTVLPNDTTDITTTICPGDTFYIGSTPYTSAGVYGQSFTSFNGCDSTVNLNLSIYTNPVTNLSQSICSGDTINFAGQKLTQAGVYHDTVADQNGCDSFVNLTVSITSILTTDIFESICDGDTFFVGPFFFTTAGAYKDTTTSINGCDSIITLNLSVLNHSATALFDSICSGESLNFNGQTISTPGTYRDTLMAFNGCDSVVVLDISQKGASAITKLSGTICEGDAFTVAGKNYTVQGTFFDTLMNVDGCDSILEIKLTVDPLPVANFSFTINETVVQFQNLSQDAGTYFWDLGNGSTRTTPTVAVNYVNAGNYTVTLIVTNNCGADTFSSDVMINVDNIPVVGATEVFDFEIVPNPNSGQFSISILTQSHKQAFVKLYDITGKQVYHSKLDLSQNNKKLEINLPELEQGLYFVHIEAGEKKRYKRMIVH